MATDRREEILRTLRQGTETSVGLAETIGVPEGELQPDLFALVKDGHVVMAQAYWPGVSGPTPAGWLYSLTGKGRQAIE